MMTPPFSISARPDLRRKVPVSRSTGDLLLHGHDGTGIDGCPAHRVYRRPPGDLPVQLDPDERAARPGRERRPLTDRLDLDVAGEELDPGSAGRQGDLGPVLREETREVVERVPLPSAPDQPAVAKD